jgi:hypothetical protein
MEVQKREHALAGRKLLRERGGQHGGNKAAGQSNVSSDTNPSSQEKQAKGGVPMNTKRGRPKRAKNITEIVDVKASRCKSCGSSRRSAYMNSDYQDFSGMAQAFIGIWRRRCYCLDCGQPRIDREEVFAANSELPNSEEA